jgi:hypothetical protein
MPVVCSHKKIDAYEELRRLLARKETTQSYVNKPRNNFENKEDELRQNLEQKDECWWYD